MSVLVNERILPALGLRRVLSTHVRHRYDDMVSAQQNMDLQTTILSRFDLIFIVRDVTTREHDERLARHICNMHQQGHASNQLEDRDEQVHSPTHNILLSSMP